MFLAMSSSSSNSCLVAVCSYFFAKDANNAGKQHCFRGSATLRCTASSYCTFSWSGSSAATRNLSIQLAFHEPLDNIPICQFSSFIDNSVNDLKYSAV